MFLLIKNIINLLLIILINLDAIYIYSVIELNFTLKQNIIFTIISYQIFLIKIDILSNLLYLFFLIIYFNSQYLYLNKRNFNKIINYMNIFYIKII